MKISAYIVAEIWAYLQMVLLRVNIRLSLLYMALLPGQGKIWYASTINWHNPKSPGNGFTERFPISDQPVNMSVGVFYIGFHPPWVAPFSRQDEHVLSIWHRKFVLDMETMIPHLVLSYLYVRGMCTQRSNKKWSPGWAALCTLERSSALLRVLGEASHPRGL